MISTPRDGHAAGQLLHGDDIGDDHLAGGAWPASWAPPLRFSRSRSRARRTEARERIRSTAPSSSPATAWMVRRPSRRCGSPWVRETALPALRLGLACAVLLVEVGPAIEVQAAGPRGLAGGALESPARPEAAGRAGPGRARPAGRRRRAAGAGAWAE